MRTTRGELFSCVTLLVDNKTKMTFVTRTCTLNVSHYLSLPSPVPVPIVSPVRTSPGVDGIGHGEPSQLLHIALTSTHHGAHDCPHQGQRIHFTPGGWLTMTHLPRTDPRARATAVTSVVASIVTTTSRSTSSVASLERHCVLSLTNFGWRSANLNLTSIFDILIEIYKVVHLFNN